MSGRYVLDLLWVVRGVSAKLAFVELFVFRCCWLYLVVLFGFDLLCLDCCLRWLFGYC